MFLVLQCQGLYPLPHPQYILAPTHHTLCLKNWSHRPPSPRVHTEVYNQPGGKKSITSGSQWTSQTPERPPHKDGVLLLHILVQPGAAAGEKPATERQD